MNWRVEVSNTGSPGVSSVTGLAFGPHAEVSTAHSAKAAQSAGRMPRSWPHSHSVVWFLAGKPEHGQKPGTRSRRPPKGGADDSTRLGTGHLPSGGRASSGVRARGHIQAEVAGRDEQWLGRDGSLV